MGRKAISFDFWKTLCRANPLFKENQYILLQEFIKGVSKEEFLTKFKEKKRFSDKMAENHGVQVNRLDMYREMYPDKWSILQIQDFVAYSNELFLKYPPIPIPEAVQLVKELKNQGHYVYVSSNTMFIHGHTLGKVIYDVFGITKHNCLFSNIVGVTKPNEAMFKFPVKPDFHIGDNPLTDGKCEDYGIKFLEIGEDYSIINNFINIINGDSNVQVLSEQIQ